MYASSMKRESERLVDEAEKARNSEKNKVSQITSALNFNKSELARQLDIITNVQIKSNLDNLGNDVVKLIESQGKEVAALKERLKIEEVHVSDYKSLATAKKKEISALKEIQQQRLDENSFYRKIKKEHAELSNSLSKCKEEMDRLISEMKGKRKEYLENEAFSYLLGREYGTGEYKGKFLARYFDNHLAFKINFSEMKRNLDIIDGILSEAPKRSLPIREELDRVSKDIETMHDSYLSSDEADKLKSELLKIEDKLKKYLDNTVEIEKNIRAYENGDDSLTIEAKRIVRGFLTSFSTQALRKMVKQSDTIEDDEALERLIEISAEIESLERKLTVAEYELETAERYYRSISDAHRSLVNSRYISDNYKVRDEKAILKAVKDCANGKITKSQLDDTIHSMTTKIAVASAAGYAVGSTSSNYSYDDDSSRNSRSSNNDFTTTNSDGGGSYSTTDSY